MPKKLPKNVFVRYRHYEGDDTVSLEANIDIMQMVDLDETCEIGYYELKKTIALIRESKKFNIVAE